MSDYSSFYLYRKYKITPYGAVDTGIVSLDGEGTMPPVMKNECEPYCGCIEPLYRWVIVSGAYECSGTYRFHKNFDMVKLSNINSIDDALTIKGLNVYINRDEYNFDGYLDEDLIGLEVYDNELYKGKIIDIYKTNIHDLLVIDGKKRHMVPNIETFVKKVDLDNKKIYIEYIGGLDNED